MENNPLYQVVLWVSNSCKIKEKKNIISNSQEECFRLRNHIFQRPPFASFLVCAYYLHPRHISKQKSTNVGKNALE